MSKLEIGAPPTGGASLTAKDIKSAIPLDQLPVTLFAVNHMPRNVSFPEFRDKGGAGLYLTNPNVDAENSVREIVVTNADQFVRGCLSVEQVCELNKFQRGITFDTEPPALVQDEEAARLAAEAKAKADEEAARLAAGGDGQAPTQTQPKAKR